MGGEPGSSIVPIHGLVNLETRHTGREVVAEVDQNFPGHVLELLALEDVAVRGDGQGAVAAHPRSLRRAAVAVAAAVAAAAAFGASGASSASCASDLQILNCISFLRFKLKTL